MKTCHAAAALLAFAILTLWVGGRWALSGVEAGAYLGASAIAITQRRIPVGIALLAPCLMCAWAALQWIAHWTVVPSATADSCLYWLAAACFVLIGSQVDRDAFLKTSLAIGLIVCVAGTIQLFTSHGDVFWLFPSGFDRRVIGPFVSPNNYAAFVELLIPVALALACSAQPFRRPGHSSKRFPYLIIAAVLAATAVASGSRTGAILVLIEIVTVLALQRSNRRAVLAFALLTTLFSLIAGQQFLAGRFAQKNDPFAVRREFLQSSLAMFRAQPLHGFGLGTWSSAYPQFAILDTGEIANHAHNEWAQWAAEGGAPALILMLGLLVCAVRPAIRSVWGIGILAVFAHSLVDYPFLRLGLAVWIFAFLGALSGGVTHRRLPAVLITPVLLFGTWQAGKLAYADVLYRRATPASVERAVALAPDRADYYFVLAQLDSSHAVAHLDRALAANGYDTQARIALALELEAAGNRSAAERSLLESAHYDHQFAPAWALANFYFRNGNTERLWLWAKKSAAISYGDRRALFDLCFLASGDAHIVLEKVVANQPVLELPFLNYLVARHRITDAVWVAQRVAQRVAQSKAPEAGDAVRNYIDAAIDAGETVAAWRVQNQIAGAQPLLLNGDFGAPLQNRGFDWKMAPTEGIAIARTQDGGPVLSIEFSGNEPELCELLSHTTPLKSGAAYIMQLDYKTEEFPSPTGISWRVGAAMEPMLDRSADWKHKEWAFRATDTPRIELLYRRAPGTTRAQGRLFLRNARIDAAPL